MLHIRRLVRVEGGALFVDDCYFPPGLVGILGLEAVRAQPIYRLLEAAGRAPAEGEQWVEVAAVPAEVAGHLGVAPGAPGLLITRVTTGALGAPLEHTTVLYRGDRYQYRIRLRRTHIQEG